ncbi:pilus assembly protein N-terminal domain-containing protein [Nitrospinae bacterium AH-259-F20]|nr:pilus assembly protein N-terminal domain-containing protein [Nitrospinae bacterium AH-259-F20]
MSTLAALMLLGPASTHAQSLKLHKGTLLEERGAPKEIRVTVGKTKLMDSTDAIQRVSVTEPKVADVVIISPHQIIINGKKIGATNLIVWNKDGSNHVFDLLISPDVELVRRRLDELLPGSQVEVEADRDRLVIFGDVSNLQTMDQIITVVQPHAPNLINLMKVKSPQQVQLQVRIALVSRPALREAGISITGARQREDRFLFSAPGSNVTEFEPTTDTGSVPLGAISDEFRIPQSVGSAFGLAFQLADTALNKQASIGGFINLLETQGFAKTLAEPTLVALSGQTASFLSGGEEPVVSVSGVGSTDVEDVGYEDEVVGSAEVAGRVAVEVAVLKGYPVGQAMVLDVVAGRLQGQGQVDEDDPQIGGFQTKGDGIARRAAAQVEGGCDPLQLKQGCDLAGLVEVVGVHCPDEPPVALRVFDELGALDGLASQDGLQLRPALPHLDAQPHAVSQVVGACGDEVAPAERSVAVPLVVLLNHAEGGQGIQDDCKGPLGAPVVGGNLLGRRAVVRQVVEHLKLSRRDDHLRGHEAPGELGEVVPRLKRGHR